MMLGDQALDKGGHDDKCKAWRKVRRLALLKQAICNDAIRPKMASQKYKLS